MARSSIGRGTFARLAFGLLAVASGIGALVVAQGPGRGTTYAGYSDLATALFLGAGFALTFAGLVASLDSRGNRIGDLALLAGFGWFAPVWIGWVTGPSLVRSLGMLTVGFIFPLLTHLVLAYPTGRLQATVDRVLVGAAYVGASLAALGAALFRDPFFDPNCWANCTDNAFLVHSLPGLSRAIQVSELWFMVIIAGAFAAIGVRRSLDASGPGRRVLLPVLVPGVSFAAGVAAHSIAMLRSPTEDPSDPVYFSIFVVNCATVTLLAGGLAWGFIRARVQRRAVSRITSSVGHAPPPGYLETALGGALGDPELRIAYWLPNSRRFVDASGQAVDEPSAVGGRALTSLVRDGRRVAVVSHAAGIPAVESEMGAAVRLALENERLQAEGLARLAELQVSRTRVVETGDEERRRLERDLHDGAQQRLLAVSYNIRLARADAEAVDDSETGAALASALVEAQAGLDELRELAHGIFPAILVEAGLDAALETFSDTAPVEVRLREVAEERYSPSVEAAAYLLVAEAVEDASARGATKADVTVARQGDLLVVDVEDDGSERRSEMVRLADRVGALNGALQVEPMLLRAEIPCA